MLKPFFPFFGSKWRIAKLYPVPREIVIEPFAGSAGYATYWQPKAVKLYDADPIIAGLWDYLIAAPEKEIERLPDVSPGEKISDLKIPQEAKWLIGFWVNRGSATPKNTVTRYTARTDKGQLSWGKKARERIMSQQREIRHWSIKHLDYREVPNEKATWFIDPPYKEKGKWYRFNKLDHSKIGQWASERLGDVIVCEHPEAGWMEFEKLVTAKSQRGFADEGVWLKISESQLKLL